MPVKQGEVHAHELQRRIRERREILEGATLANDGVAAVLRRAYAHIQSAADENRSSCTFEVPMGVLGSAPYDLAPCIEQLLDRLKQRGFTVDYLFPRTLFVYWTEDDSEVAASMQPLLEPGTPPGVGPPPQQAGFDPSPPQLVVVGPTPGGVPGSRRGGRTAARGGRGRSSADYRPIHEFETLTNKSSFALPY